MNKQSQWLFEAPLTSEAAQYINQKYYSNPELDAEWELQQGNSAEYPSSEWMPAATVNFTTWKNKSLRPIDKVVIHITDGPTIQSTINWFQNSNQIIKVKDPKTGNLVDLPIKVSAHYVIGQDGKVVQMVKHSDIAHHASSSNASSIGIEHVARKSGKNQLPPTQAQYCSSAALVNWLCRGFGIPMNRLHILGHSEAAPADHHDCPSSLWNWQYYMRLVTSGSCFPLS